MQAHMHKKVYDLELESYKVDNIEMILETSSVASKLWLSQTRWITTKSWPIQQEMDGIVNGFIKCSYVI